MNIFRPGVGATTDKVSLSIPVLNVGVRSQVAGADESNCDPPFVLIVQDLPLPVSDGVDGVANFDFD